MSWTYDKDFSIPLNVVRLLITDIDEAEPLLEDEELAYFLTANGDNIKMAALDAARVIHSKFAKAVDTEVGDLKKFWSQRASGYKEVLTRLEKEVSAIAVPYAGGVTLSDKQVNEDNTDLVEPSFTRRTHDNTIPLNNTQALE